MTRTRRAGGVAAAIAAMALAAGCASGSGTATPSSTTTSPGSQGPGTSAPGTSTAPATTTDPGRTDATPADDGDQPQTRDLPDAEDPAFQQRTAALWKAIVDDDPDQALGSFFPLGAYRQVKAVSDPDGDYQDRLIAAFRQDVHQLHQQLGGADATFEGIDVPTGDARWITPGVEANKGSYWRVFGSTIRYAADGQEGTMAVTSLISWRGQWYVVHLGAIR